MTDITNARADRSALITVTVFPLFILAGTVLALIFPAPFQPWSAGITYFLMIIMFAMGLTLTIPDFTEVLRRPIPIIIGIIFQYTIMPLAAIAVAKVLGLNPALAVGLLMLGSVPGGTSSNVIAFLARGDVALSVTMTSFSTVLSPIITPALMLLLAGANTEVNASGMAISLAQTVLLPVIGGLVIRHFFNEAVNKITPILPTVSILGIGGVVFPTVANSGEKLITSGFILIVAVLAHNTIGYILGYVGAKVFRMPDRSSRTMSAEVATQSAGLSSTMSANFFSAEAALPGAVAAVLHNITGAIYAAIMRNIPLKEDQASSTSSI